MRLGINNQRKNDRKISTLETETILWQIYQANSIASDWKKRNIYFDRVFS